MKNITVIGTGYVGLVSGAGISGFGHNVTWVYIDDEKFNELNNLGIIFDKVDRIKP